MPEKIEHMLFAAQHYSFTDITSRMVKDIAASSSYCHVGSDVL